MIRALILVSALGCPHPTAPLPNPERAAALAVLTSGTVAGMASRDAERRGACIGLRTWAGVAREYGLALAGSRCAASVAVDLTPCAGLPGKADEDLVDVLVLLADSIATAGIPSMPAELSAVVVEAARVAAASEADTYTWPGTCDR